MAVPEGCLQWVPFVVRRADACVEAGCRQQMTTKGLLQWVDSNECVQSSTRNALLHTGHIQQLGIALRVPWLLPGILILEQGKDCSQMMKRGEHSFTA